MAPESPSISRRRTKRVSAQHTLERVRNNQRRHRARRKGHIEMLEQKLGEAEQTILDLKNQVETLQGHKPSEPAWRSLHLEQPCGPDSTSPSPCADTLVVRVHGSSNLLASGDQPGPSLEAVDFTNWSSEFSPGPPLSIESASNYYTGVENRTPKMRPSPDTQLPASVADRMTLTSSQEASQLLPTNVLQSAMEASYQATSYGEPTILCSEAYILINQQNRKGMTTGDVDGWLCSGFRMPFQLGEGCRVNTDILFTLLVYMDEASDPQI